MKNILLDTNAISYFLSGSKKLLKIFEKSDLVCISVISLGELIYGFKSGSKELLNKKTLNEKLTDPKIKIVKVTKTSAEIYSELKFKLRKLGTPIPDNDIWIAAQAIETDSILITYDEHFLKVKGLKLWPRILK